MPLRLCRRTVPTPALSIMKTTVIHHSADYDGIFCREIARKFLPDAELIGWDFADKPIPVPPGDIYILDLPIDRVFGLSQPIRGVDGERAWDFLGANQKVVWIDHHKSSIESHPKDIPGYRIDGVAACRLAWQWFNPDGFFSRTIPPKEAYIDRKVSEPLAVRLAGEYDIWDHRGDGDLEFQFGLDAQKEIHWDRLFEDDHYTMDIADEGGAAMQCYKNRDADIVRERSFLVEFEGLKFLCLNTARCNSNSFAAKDIPETGHDALMAFFWNGTGFTVSMYHAAHRKDIDLSLLAVKHGGGGHRGACGFRAQKLPFLP